MNLFDLGMLLIAQEESPIAGLKTSIDNLEQKYSVGDMFRIKFSPQGINIEKL